MKNSLFTLLTFLLLLNETLFAQAKRFVTEGSIEFEKTANMFASFSKAINKDNESFLQPLFEEYKQKKPQFLKLKSTLIFRNNKTFFDAEPTEDQLTIGMTPLIAQNNLIYSDLTTESSIVQKTVFEQVFLVKDSIRSIKWKITDEKRDIAGYSCRRANAIIMDSIYVVAFYTDQIPVSGGPESFNGLPGMILGVAIPHENVTWFATHVHDQTIDPASIKVPVKGKPSTKKSLRAVIEEVSKEWGQFRQAALKGFLL